MSGSLWPHGLQHARTPCPSLSPEFAQTHVHWVDDAIQPSHPLSSPSSAFNLSQHQGLFQWINSSHQVAKVLELQLQHQSFQMNIQDWFPLGLTGLISFQCKEFSRILFSTTIQKHQFFSTQLSLWSNSHIHISIHTGKTISLTIQTFACIVMPLLFNGLSKSELSLQGTSIF